MVHTYTCKNLQICDLGENYSLIVWIWPFQNSSNSIKPIVKDQQNPAINCRSISITAKTDTILLIGSFQFSVFGTNSISRVTYNTSVNLKWFLFHSAVSFLDGGKCILPVIDWQLNSSKLDYPQWERAQIIELYLILILVSYMGSSLRYWVVKTGRHLTVESYCLPVAEYLLC